MELIQKGASWKRRPDWPKQLLIKSLKPSSLPTPLARSFGGTRPRPRCSVIPPEEALGQSVDLIIPERLRTAHWRGFNAALTKGATTLQGRPTLTRALHKGGHRLYVEMSFAIVKRFGCASVGCLVLPEASV